MRLEECPEVPLEYCECPMGCNSSDDAVLKGYDRLTGQPGAFTVVKCRACGLMRTNPRPTPSAITVFYPDNYSPYQPVRGRREPSLWKRTVRMLGDVRSRSVPAIPSGSMLDVGCAHGGFMRQMADRGWRVTGIEYSPSAASEAAADGLSVHVGSLESAPEMPMAFDLITAWMVLEHLHDPVGGLRKLRRWIRPDGWLAFSVPNAAAGEFRLFAHNNFNLDVPRHLFHFTPSTLATVLQRSGWSLARILHQRTMASTVRSLGHVCEEKGWRRAARWIHGFAKKTAFTNTMLYPLATGRAIFQQSDRITVWARPAA
jgi:2-polyprenyl-3-methyl-5-hydroxy-6-metoxy-1,4-benzoquinol methylase